MDLTRAVVETKAAEYAADGPLYAVEAEQIDGLPGAFASGDFGWRDAMWVVQWYYRRSLGAYPDERRRAAEAEFGENDFEAIQTVIGDVVSTTGDARKVQRLTDLVGVDVPVASAFLQFIDPEAYIVVGDREWTVLREAGELTTPYPDPPSVDAYVGYLDTCRAITGRVGCDLWTLYRALWRLYPEM